MTASRIQLEEAGGEDRDICVLIDAARTLVEVSLKEHLRTEPVDLSSPVIQQYLRVYLGKRQNEWLYAIFVDSDCCFLKDEMIGLGGRHSVETRFAHLFRRAIELRSVGMVLAHNHPSGDCTPGQKDIETTRIIEQTAMRLDLVLHDHLIVTHDKIFSIMQERHL